jgi:Fe-S cluster biogenesis protein NfuA
MPAVDQRSLDEAVAWVNGRLRMHGGGIVVDAVRDGHVEVRFVGMCCGCAWKSLTWFGTVRDAIAAVDGVVEVTAPGTRVSEQAEARMAAALRPR